MARVMVVDDDVTVREVVASYLRAHRHDTIESGDGAEALRLFQDEPVDLMCLVVSAPWMRSADAVDFGRLVGAPRNLAIHDKVYSEIGLGIVDGHLGRLLPESQSYVRLADGADLE